MNTKKLKDLLPLLAMVLGVLAFTSCSESNGDTVDEFADWQNKNETYWSDLYTATQSRIAQGDSTWRIIPYWAVDGLEPTQGTVEYGPMQHIIVHVLETGAGTETPAYTDSVRVHYEGHLIPSETYTAGYRFDASYTGSYSPVTSNPTILKISGVVDGMATALLKMRAGDHWMVYMPFTLGYGKKEQSGSSIPAYSNLVFDLRMVDICR